MSTIITLMDGLFLIRYSIHAFNAVVLVIPLVGLVTSLGSGLAVAVAEGLGREKDKGKYVQHIIASMLLATVVSLVLIVFAYARPGLFSSLAGLGSGDALQEEKHYFSEYWLWITPTFLFQMLLIPGLQVLIYFGRTRKSNIILTLLAVTNLVLAPVFIFSLHMGTMGAALATDAAYVSGLVVAYLLNKVEIQQLLMNSRQKIHLLFHEGKGILFKQLKTAMLVFCSISTFIAGNILLNNLAASMGIAALSVTGASEQLKSFFTLPTRAVTGSYLVTFYESLKRKAIAEYVPVYWNATVIVAGLYGIAILAFLLIPGFFIFIYHFEAPHLASDFRYVLFVSAMILLLSIFTRTAIVGFLGLDRPFMLFFQSAFTVGAGYFFSWLFSGRYGLRGIIDGQLLGMIIVTLFACGYFFFLLHRQIRADRSESNADKTIST